MNVKATLKTGEVVEFDAVDMTVFPDREENIERIEFKETTNGTQTTVVYL